MDIQPISNKVMKLEEIQESGNREIITLSEIFYSIQGESNEVGRPTIFIRTAECPLRCNWCDTKYGHAPGLPFTVTSILEEVKKYHCRNICITGGEPMAQPNILSLLKCLEHGKYKVSVETGGSISVRNFVGLRNTSFIVDVKCPSSGMEKKNYLDMIPFLRAQDQLKFVVGDKEDFNYMMLILKNKRFQGTVLMSPQWELSQEEKLETVKWFLEENWIMKHAFAHPEKFKVSLQTHKILYGPDPTGKKENQFLDENNKLTNNQMDIQKMEEEGAIVSHNPQLKTLIPNV